MLLVCRTSLCDLAMVVQDQVDSSEQSSLRGRCVLMVIYLCLYGLNQRSMIDSWLIGERRYSRLLRMKGGGRGGIVCEWLFL